MGASRPSSAEESCVGSTDADLIRKIVERDEDAFAQLVLRHGPKAHGLARRVLRHPTLAEDVTQESFLRVWQMAARYRPDRGSVSAWLMTIVHHASVDRVRREESQRRLTFIPGEIDGEDFTGDLVSRLDGPADQRRVRAALTALPASQRQVIEMMYLDGCSQSQVAEKLALPLGTVKSRCLLGMRKLRDLLTVVP